MLPVARAHAFVYLPACSAHKQEIPDLPDSTDIAPTDGARSEHPSAWNLFFGDRVCKTEFDVTLVRHSNQRPISVLAYARRKVGRSASRRPLRLMMSPRLGVV